MWMASPSTLTMIVLQRIHSIFRKPYNKVALIEYVPSRREMMPTRNDAES